MIINHLYLQILHSASESKAKEKEITTSAKTSIARHCFTPRKDGFAARGAENGLKIDLLKKKVSREFGQVAGIA